MTVRKDRNTVVTKVESDEGRLLKQEIPENGNVSTGPAETVIKSNVFYGTVVSYDPLTRITDIVSEGKSYKAINYTGLVLSANDNVVFSKLTSTSYVLLGVKK